MVYEAMHLIRKGQIRWLPQGDVVGQRRFIHTLFGIASYVSTTHTSGLSPPSDLFATDPNDWPVKDPLHRQYIPAPFRVHANGDHDHMAPINRSSQTFS
jgi:hypothetical protein